MKSILLIILISIIGAIIRFNNISPYKFYPDAYQSLIVARNLQNYHSVLGYLGEKGAVFPDFVAWTRPGYPLLINLIKLFTSNELQAAQLVAFFAGVFSIPVAFLFVQSVFHSKSVGLFAAFLLTITFNHTVWGGFILTESVAVFVSLLFLWRLFTQVSKKSLLGDFNDLILGIILAFACLTRYENLLWIIPTVFIIFKLNSTPYIKVLNVLLSFIFTISLFVYSFFPVFGQLNSILYQIQYNLKLGAFMLLIFVGFVIASKRINLPADFSNYIPKVLIILIWTIPIILILQQPLKLAGMKAFFRDDLMLGITSLLGMTYMLKDKKHLSQSLFVLFTYVLFSAIYYQINPLIQRYTTHLIPVLLIPASFGLSKLMSGWKIAVLATFTLYQIYITSMGIKNWDNGEWFKISYEEKAAKILANKIQDKDTLLLVSFPESYYYFTNLSTYSITDSQPFVFIDSKLDNSSIVIVEDMGMRNIFPNFSKILENELSQFKIDEFWVGEKYHYKIDSKVEDKGVILYKMKLIDLKNKLLHSSLNI